jgi:hypothetical protein
MDGGIVKLVAKSANRFVMTVLPALNADGTIPLDGSNQIKNFWNYHILAGSIYLDDGYERVQLSTGEIVDRQQPLTLHKLPLSSTYLLVNKVSNRLHFTNVTQSAVERREATVVPGENRSNLFARRGVLHEIDNYFIPPVE